MQNIDMLLKPSIFFISLILMMTGGSLVIIYFLPIFHLIKIFLSLITLEYGRRILWREGFLRHPQSILGLSLNKEGAWQLRSRSKEISAILLGESTVTPFVCVLRFALPHQRKKQSCVIFKDSVKKEVYRKFLSAILVVSHTKIR